MNTTYGKRFQNSFQEARTSAAWQEEGIRLDFVEFVIKYMAQQGLTENDRVSDQRRGYDYYEYSL